MDYTTPGQVKITMIDFIKEIIDAFDKKADLNGGGTTTKASTGPADLFKMDNHCEKINMKQATKFHNLTANT